jgi:hypothetical protein
VRSIVYKPDFTPRQLTFGQVPCFVYNKSLDDELASELMPEGGCATGIWCRTRGTNSPGQRIYR